MIIQHRKKAFIISGVLILAALFSMAYHMVVTHPGSLGLNLGEDFVGGTVLEMNLGEEFEVDEVREILQAHGQEGASVQRVMVEEDDGELVDEGVLIKTGIMGEDARDDLVDSFRERWEVPAEETRIESVGAAVGAEQRRTAIIAVAVALVGMVAYITFRFEFNFAIAAIAALVHDVLIVLGIFSLLQLELNEPFVAALLTIVGYSVNDSIVIIDRIRENIRYRSKKEYPEVVNHSIMQNLTRSINTSFTTLLVLAALMVGFYVYVGSFDLIVFVIAMIIGVIVGTYSSIFIASPLWLTLKERQFRKAAQGQ